MVTIEFQRSGAASRLEDPLDMPAGVLARLFFTHPVRFAVDHLVLIDEPIPILQFATEGLRALETLETEGQSIILLDGGDIELRKMADEVEVFSGRTDLHAQVNLHDLDRSFHKFASEVSDFLRNEYPFLLQHPYWGEWLRNASPRM